MLWHPVLYDSLPRLQRIAYKSQKMFQTRIHVQKAHNNIKSFPIGFHEMKAHLFLEMFV